MKRTMALAIAGVLLLPGCRSLHDSPDDGGVLGIESDVGCSSCTIVMEPVATLDSLDFNGPDGTIVRDATGRIYLVDNGLLLMYAPDGRFVRQIGRRGGGPGEYETIRVILMGATDQLHVLDQQLGRHSVFDSSGVFVHGVTTSAALVARHAVMLEGERMAVNRRPMFPNSEVAFVDIVDEAGSSLHAIQDTVIADPLETWPFLRRLAVRRSGELLVVEPYSFVLHQYDPSFASKRSFRRLADWTPVEPPATSPSDGTFDVPYTANIRAIWEDAEGLIWLQMTVPSADWEPAAPYDRQNPPSSEEYGKLGQRPRVDAIIEAIDLEEVQVVARLRVPGVIGTAFGEGYYARLDEDADGIPQVQISRVTLRR